MDNAIAYMNATTILDGITFISDVCLTDMELLITV